VTTKIGETKTPTHSFEPEGIPDTLFIPTEAIPERYVGRIELAQKTPLAALYRAMGVEITESGVALPLHGIRTNLEAHGVACRFDLQVVDGAKASPAKYLSLVEADYGPIGYDPAKPEFVLHDIVFHGPGFEGADGSPADLMQAAARRALLSGNPEAMSDCTNAIDGLTSSFFSAMTIEGTDLEEEVRGSFTQLAQVLGAGVPNESSVEGMRAQRRAQAAAVSADTLAHSYVTHFSDVLAQLAAA
jgi:hypothetical protein